MEDDRGDGNAQAVGDFLVDESLSQQDPEARRSQETGFDDGNAGCHGTIGVSKNFESILVLDSNHQIFVFGVLKTSVLTLWTPSRLDRFCQFIE